MRLARDRWGGVDFGVVGHGVATGAQRHDDFLERGVAGAFAQAIDGALDLARTAADGGQRVGDGEAQVVVAMGREDHLVGAGDALDDRAEHRLVLGRDGVAHGIGQVDGGGAGLDGELDAAGQVIDRGAGRVHGRPLDIVDEVARLRDGGRDDLEHLLLGLAHLVRQMDRRGGNEGVDAALPGVAYGFAGAGDIGRDGAGEAGDHRVLHLLGDGHDGFEIAVGGDREAGLDDIDAHFVEGSRRPGAFLPASWSRRGSARRRATWYRR